MVIRPRVGLIVCTHFCKEHLHVMLGCPLYEHWIWSTDVWAKHICTHHPGLPIFVEIKLECAIPEESKEVLVVLTASQIPSDVPSTSA